MVFFDAAVEITMSAGVRAGEQTMIRYVINASVSNAALNALFASAWPEHVSCDFSSVFAGGLGHICAFDGDDLIGFVNVAWDGAKHAFLLDPTVRGDLQRKGVGSELVRLAAGLAKARGVEWLHVDYEPRLADFYCKCGFRHT